MYNTNDVLAMLNNGFTPDEIAKSFTETLNKAIQEKKEADEAAKAALRAKESKRADLKEIIDLVVVFLSAHYPEIMPEPIVVSDEGVDNLLEELDDMVPEAKAILDFMKKFPGAKEIKVKPKIAVPGKDRSSEAIERFLKDFGLM